MSHRVVAVVLAKDAIDELPRVVAAVDAQTIRPESTIVVDNASTDGTADWLKTQEGVEVLFHAENLGVGAGHNRGWTAALAHDPAPDFIWALEHDTIPEPGCLERLLTTFDAERAAGAAVAAVGPVQELPSEPSNETGPPYRHRTLSFNGTLFSAAAVTRVGAIREDFFIGHEDREFAFRLREAGYVLFHDPGARVLHRNKGARKRARPSVVRAYYGNRNEAYLMVHVRREPRARARVLGRTVWGVGRALFRETQKSARIRARLRATVDGLRSDLGKKHYRFLEERA